MSKEFQFLKEKLYLPHENDNIIYFSRKRKITPVIMDNTEQNLSSSMPSVGDEDNLEQTSPSEDISDGSNLSETGMTEQTQTSNSIPVSSVAKKPRMTNVVNNVASAMRNFNSSAKMGVDSCVELRRKFMREPSCALASGQPRKNHTLNFTPRVRVPVVNNPLPAFPETTDEFWTSGPVQAIGDSLLVKRHRDGAFDHVHLAKITTYGRSLFKIPTSMVETLVSRMEGLLMQIEVDESGKYHYPGITEPTPQDDLADDYFWNEEVTIKIVKFRLRPYLSIFGKLTFRMLMEVSDEHKRYNLGKVCWAGPSSALSFDNFRALLEVFKGIKASKN